MLARLLRWIADKFGQDGYYQARKEIEMDWQKMLENALKDLEDVELGIILEGFEIAATGDYKSAVHYVLLAHNAEAGAEAAGITVEQARKALKGSVCSLH